MTNLSSLSSCTRIMSLPWRQLAQLAELPIYVQVAHQSSTYCDYHHHRLTLPRLTSSRARSHCTIPSLSFANQTHHSMTTSAWCSPSPLCARERDPLTWGEGTAAWPPRATGPACSDPTAPAVRQRNLLRVRAHSRHILR
jgi:hypothetical protein